MSKNLFELDGVEIGGSFGRELNAGDEAATIWPRIDKRLVKRSGIESDSVGGVVCHNIYAVGGCDY